VTDPCPYCGAGTRFADSVEIYGTSYGQVLMCSNWPKCDAFVGCHKSTGLPKGTLANAALREARKTAHATFDPVLSEGHMSRSDAYRWLADEMHMAPRRCHIGMMSVVECERVIALSASMRAEAQCD
jgi:hypothetical protein